MKVMWITKKWTRDKIQNLGISQYLKTETLQEKLVTLRIQWYEHTLFMNDEYLSKHIKWIC
jgi:hypothetical protein